MAPLEAVGSLWILLRLRRYRLHLFCYLAITTTDDELPWIFADLSHRRRCGVHIVDSLLQLRLLADQEGIDPQQQSVETLHSLA